MDKKIVVTGIGIQSCLGSSVDEYWDSLLEGKSGIRTITQVSSTDFPCKVSGEVQNFEPGNWMNPKEAKRMGRFSQLAVAAAKDAIEQSNFLGNVENDRVGVLIGTGAGGLPETDQQAKLKESRGVMRMSPFYIPSMLSNMASANISRIYQATGYNNTCITACAASTQAVGEALEKIRSNKSAKKSFIGANGILILPGFGSRGSEGKILSSRYARENNIPFLGICLGMQCAVIDFARNVCKLEGANSTEFDKNTKYPVIDLMESQRAIKIKGGTMRLGAYDCEIKKGTKNMKI